jgi:hypothetical protein
MITEAENIRIWKWAAMAYFKVLSRHSRNQDDEVIFSLLIFRQKETVTQHDLVA